MPVAAATRRVLRQLGAFAATILLGGLLTATLIRTSPGFQADERLLDPRLDASSRAAIENEHAGQRNVAAFYWRYLGKMIRGDLGVSQSLDRPIAGLIADRAPVTAGIIAAGVAGGWTLAGLLAIAVVVFRLKILSGFAGALSACGLCIPSAATAVLIFAVGGPARLVIALVLFPKLFEYLRSLLQDAMDRPHIFAARAKGVSPARILVRHVIPTCAPEFLALAGASVTMAFGAAIPVETLSDLPGLGQLAWKAATARDLPLLVSLTMLITIGVQLCNAASDWATAAVRGRRA